MKSAPKVCISWQTAVPLPISTGLTSPTAPRIAIRVKGPTAEIFEHSGVFHGLGFSEELTTCEGVQFGRDL